MASKQAAQKVAGRAAQYKWVKPEVRASAGQAALALFQRQLGSLSEGTDIVRDLQMLGFWHRGCVTGSQVSRLSVLSSSMPAVEQHCAFQAFHVDCLV